jgi:hypothetical protein
MPDLNRISKKEVWRKVMEAGDYCQTEASDKVMRFYGGLKMKVKRSVIMILTIMCILVTVLNVTFKYLLLMFLPFKFDSDLRDAASVGIIGSADGPTSILVANSTASIIITMISALLSISGIIYLIRTREKNNDIRGIPQ